MANTDNSNTLGNGLKVAAEVLVTPGSSLILDGNIGSGLLHVVGGIASKVALGATFGPIVAAGVMLNSYAKSTSGISLVDLASAKVPKPATPVKDAPLSSVAAAS